MREIKFRAWNKREKSMVLFTLKQINQENIRFHDLDEWLIMQYTGLKDKNGKEIYEGDILLGTFDIKQVENYIFLGLTDKEKETGSKTFIVEDIFYLYTNPVPDDIEVIGNIYENPELVKSL